MVNDRRVVIAIDTDLSGLNSGAASASKTIGSLSDKVKILEGSTTKLDAGLKAFSWTTFAGGALNVSTAVAQLYTSISNLDRVQLQVKNSMVGVERAEDLLARKTMMLNKEMDKNGSLSEKSIRLRNEIATATDDLANKEEKLRLAQDTVNDTYILFTSNVVNTVFGTMQTLAGLYAMVAQRKIVDTAVTAMNSGATKINNAARIESAITAGMQALANGGVTVANIANTASTWSLTVAMRALGAAVKANPLFLPATLATLAIGVGVTAYEMDQMGKRSKEAEEKLSVTASTVGMTSTEFSELSSIIGTGSAAMADYGSAAVDASTKIEILNKALDDLQKKQESINKQKGRRGEQNVKAVEEDINKITTEIAKHEKQIADENAILNKAFISYATGDIKNINSTQLNIIENQIAAVSKWADKWDAVVEGSEDYVVALNLSLDLIETEGTILKENRNYIQEILLSRKDINKEGDKEITNSQKLLKMYKEIVDLQKKTTNPHHIIGQNKEIFKNFELGEYGLSDSFVDRILGTSKNGDLGYMPFSGYINSKSKQVILESQLINTANNLSMYYAQLEQLVQIIPTDENKEFIIKAMQDVRNNIDRERIGGNNFVGVGMRHPIALSAAKQISQSIDDVIRIYKSMPTPRFDGGSTYDKGYLSSIQRATKTYNSFTGETTDSPFSKGKIIRNTDGSYTRTGEGITTRVVGGGTQTSINPRASPLGGKLNYSPASTSQFTTLTKSRSKGSKGRKPRGPTPEYYANIARSAMGTEENARLLGLTGIDLSHQITERTWYGASKSVTYHFDQFNRNLAQAQSIVNVGNQISALGIFDPDFTENIYRNTQSEINSILQREQDQINHQSGLIGETREYVIALRNSPQPELFDRIRYSERLEQISTGATVF